MTIQTIEVDPGDPHNEQLAAATSQDLTNQIASVRDVLAQAEVQDAPLSAVLAVVASSYVAQDITMNRERLSSLLALALVRLAAEDGPEGMRHRVEMTVSPSGEPEAGPGLDEVVPPVPSAP